MLSQQYENEVDLAGFISELIRLRSMVLFITILVAAVVGIAVLSRDDRFTVSSAVAPASTGSGIDTRIRGIASQLGLGAMGQGVGASAVTSSGVLETLARSEVFLRRVVDTVVANPERDAELVNLFDLLIEYDSIRARKLIPREVRVANGARALGTVLRVDRDRETDLLQVSVRTTWPAISFVLSERLLREFDNVNRRVGQSQATAERAFVDGRVQEQERRVIEAEERLAAFLRQNRQFSLSPELTVERDRLHREVSLQQQVLAGLSQASEEARIRQVRDTPVLMVLQAPVLPVEPDRRELGRWLLLGALLGWGIGLLYVLVSMLVGNSLASADGSVIRLVESLKRLGLPVERLLSVRTGRRQ